MEVPFNFYSKKSIKPFLAGQQVTITCEDGKTFTGEITSVTKNGMTITRKRYYRDQYSQKEKPRFYGVALPFSERYHITKHETQKPVSR